MTTELKVGQPLGKGPPERSQQVSVHGSRFSRLGSRPQKAGAQRKLLLSPPRGATVNTDDPMGRPCWALANVEPRG